MEEPKVGERREPTVIIGQKRRYEQMEPNLPSLVHRPQARWNEKPQCNECGKQQHMAGSKACFKCGQKGHIAMNPRGLGGVERPM